MSIKVVQQLADLLRAEGALVLRLVGRQRFANRPNGVSVRPQGGYPCSKTPDMVRLLQLLPWVRRA